MKKLLKDYSLQSDMEYYEMIITSFHNGQFTQAYNQFTTLPRKYRLEMLKAMTVGGWNSGLGDHKIKELFDRA